MPDSDNKEKNAGQTNTLVNAGLAGAQAEVIQRFGDANKQHFVAYEGSDRESGQQMAKGLKKIAQSKVNPEYRDANIKQQAGFAAEEKTVARENAEKIISGNNKTKTIRTDDMQKTKQPDSKGNVVGGRNDPLYDLTEIDSSTGICVEGTARQLKFIGGTAEECADNLLLKKYDKYRDVEVPIEIPSDFYDGVKKEMEDRAEKIRKQIETAEKKGNTELASKKKAELEKVEKTSKALRKGKLTKDEAIEARLHPKRSTTKDIARISHRAGVEAAKSGVVIGGGMSFIRNSVGVIKGDQKPEQAILEIAKDTASAGILSYATGFVGAALKGGMQNASAGYVRALSITNLPGAVVTVGLETGKTLKRYADGEINGTECLTELGEKGTGMLASSLGAAVGAGGLSFAKGAAIGSVVIPVPVIGGLLGGMIGYSLASSYYKCLVTALEKAKIAREERLIIEAECSEAVIAIREYRMEMELVIANYLRENTKVFNEAFVVLESAYVTGDVDEFIASANRITSQLGGEPLFRSKRQFDELMSGSVTIRM